MKARKGFLILVCFLSLTAASFAEGDEKEQSVLGKVIDKVASPLGGIFSPYHRLDPIVVTPTRYEDPSLNVSSNVSVIDVSGIKDSQATYVPDVLRKSAGVVVGDLLGNGKAARVDIRGFGDSAPSNVLVLVDGRRTNQVDLSGADWQQIDLGSIERIEVVRGPQSVLYGDNATGGVINIITKSGAGKKPTFEFDYDVGSYRYSSYRGSFLGGSDFMDYAGVMSTSYNNGYRINNRLETADYNGNFTIKPTDDMRVRLSGGYHRDWYGLPGAVKPVDINSIGRRGSISPANSAKTMDYYLMLTPESNFDIGFGNIIFSADMLVRDRRTSAMFFSTFGDVSNVHHIRTYGFTPKCAFTTEIFDIKNRIAAGFDLYFNKDEINSGELSAMDTIIINKNTGGLYLTDTLELPWPIILNGGFRTEWAYYKFDQQAVLHGKNEKKPFEHAIDAGVIYKYNDRSSIYAQYSRSYRFPVTEEWYSSLYVDYFSGLIAGGLNLALKPQTANNYEIGIKEFSSKYINVKADYNIMDVKNELYYDSVTNQNSVHHHTVHHGLELETDVYLLDSIHGFANYTYQKAFFVGEAFAGNSIPLVPRHKFSAGLKYTFKDCVSVIYNVNYVGLRRFANDLQNNMPRLKQYMTHDIKFSYTKYGFEMYCQVKNIFDTEYTEYGALDFTLTRPGYYPNPRQNVAAGVKYSF